MILFGFVKVSPTSYFPRTWESEREKLVTESDVTPKPGLCGCMTSHAMLIAAIIKTKMVTNKSIRFRGKRVSAHLVLWLLVGAIGLDVFLLQNRYHLRDLNLISSSTNDHYGQRIYLFQYLNRWLGFWKKGLSYHDANW